jgi:hypothetical protein
LLVHCNAVRRRARPKVCLSFILATIRIVRARALLESRLELFPRPVQRC